MQKVGKERKLKVWKYTTKPKLTSHHLKITHCVVFIMNVKSAYLALIGEVVRHSTQLHWHLSAKKMKLPSLFAIFSLFKSKLYLFSKLIEKKRKQQERTRIKFQSTNFVPPLAHTFLLSTLYSFKNPYH